MKPKDSDLELWRRAMRGVKPLRGPTSEPTAAPTSAAVLKDNPLDKRDSGVSPKQVPPLPPPPRQPEKIAPRLEPDKLPYLQHGEYKGVDRGTARRFQRGRMDVDARLDLHGMTQKQAHQALESFFSRADTMGWRAVLIITGKGRSSYEAGVLRRVVPMWLNESKFRRKILAFSYAKTSQGGMGALHVLLRRKT